MNLVSKFSDRINPITVKEMRQSLYTMPIMLILALALLMILFFLLLPSTLLLGELITPGIMAGVMFVSQIIALTHGVRMIRERAGDDDLLYTTTLSPFKIISGKFAAILINSFMAFCISLPFLVGGFYAGGVDFGDVVFGLIMLFLGVCFYASLVLALAAVRTHGKLGILRLLPAVLYLTFASILFDKNYENMLFIAAMTPILFTLAMAGVANPASNRSVVARITTLIAVILMSMATSLIYDDYDVFIMYPFMSITIAIIMFLLCACEPIKVSRKILDGTPRNRIAALLYALISSNAYSGWLYAMILGGVMVCLIALREGWNDTPTTEIMAICAYFAAYSGICIYIRSATENFARVNRRPYSVAIIVVVIVAVLTAVIVAFRELNGCGNGYWLFFSPAMVAIDSDAALTYSTVMLAVATLFLLPGISQNVKQFLAAAKAKK